MTTPVSCMMHWGSWRLQDGRPAGLNRLSGTPLQLHEKIHWSMLDAIICTLTDLADGFDWRGLLGNSAFLVNDRQRGLRIGRKRLCLRN